MDVFFTVIAYAGLAIVVYQTWPYFNFFKQRGPENIPLLSDFPLVSIIIPARNEEKNLPALLDSLVKLDYPNFEIIVVDDQSEDATYQIASNYPLTLVRATPKPAGWVGKNWACHIGTRFAKGSLLLFTDADTIHTPDSLTNAVQFMLANKCILISAPSFHSNEHWWEKLMGPFHFLVTVAATPYNQPTLENPYAIGQYLLFDAGFYQNTGGHAAIKSSLAEDVDLARNTLQHKGCYRIYTRSVLYRVQMYHSFRAFMLGWSRLLRLGMQNMDISAIIISTFTIIALTSFHAPEGGLIRWIPTLGVLLCIHIVQKRNGKYSLLGVLLFPVSTLLFIALGLHAMCLYLLNMPVQWRGRAYPQTAQA
jgi:glycosyltransferase involved in cell wall biosynthesis